MPGYSGPMEGTRMTRTAPTLTLRGAGDLVVALPYLLGYQLLRTNDGVTMRPWACPVGREGGLRVV